MPRYSYDVVKGQYNAYMPALTPNFSVATSAAVPTPLKVCDLGKDPDGFLYLATLTTDQISLAALSTELVVSAFLGVPGTYKWTKHQAQTLCGISGSVYFESCTSPGNIDGTETQDLLVGIRISGTVTTK